MLPIEAALDLAMLKMGVIVASALSIILYFSWLGSKLISTKHDDMLLFRWITRIPQMRRESRDVTNPAGSSENHPADPKVATPRPATLWIWPPI